MGIKTRVITYKRKVIQDVFWFGFTMFAIGVGLFAIPDNLRDGDYGWAIFFAIFTALNIWIGVREYQRLRQRFEDSYIDDLPGAQDAVRLEVTVERQPKV